MVEGRSGRDTFLGQRVTTGLIALTVVFDRFQTCGVEQHQFSLNKDFLRIRLQSSDLPGLSAMRLSRSFGRQEGSSHVPRVPHSRPIEPAGRVEDNTPRAASL